MRTTRGKGQGTGAMVRTEMRARGQDEGGRNHTKKSGEKSGEGA